MKKKALFLALCLAVLALLFPAIVAADGETSGKCGDDLYWSFDETNGKLTITGSGAMYDYMERYDRPWNRFNIKTVSLPSGLTAIGKNAFQNTGLTSIAIPNNVTSIGVDAFWGCSSLTSVTIPNRVTNIGEYAFGNCWSLTSVTIPSSVTSISNGVFSNTGLTSVTIPNSVTSIGDEAFFQCTGLKSITIPDSITSIGKWAFHGCIGLTSVTIPSGVTSIKERTFYNCRGLTSVTIPNTVTDIGNDAFEGCTGLTSITIPNSVITIGRCAFYNCSGLTTASIGNKVTTIEDYAFDNCKKLTSVTIPSSVTTVGSAVFRNCSELTSATIQSSYIGFHMFYGCTRLTTVKIGRDVTQIGQGAFYNCTKLTSITIPGSVDTIHGDAFYNCTGMTSIIIPNSVTLIDLRSFSGCTGLTDVYYLGTEEDRAQMRIDESGNDLLLNATWHCIPASPTITTQPKAVTVYVGKKATFKVVAQGEELSYQWQYKKPGALVWTNVSKNGTSAAYSLTAALRHNGYKYRCKVINAKGRVYSKTVTLTVSENPVIKTQPKAVTVKDGAKATFKVVADGATGYQWQYQKPGETGWTNVSKNGTAASYTLTAAARHNGYIYRCKVTNDKGSVYSGQAKLTVKLRPPTILTQPTDVRIKEGDKAVFSVVAEGSDLHYQWEVQNPDDTAWRTFTLPECRQATFDMRADLAPIYTWHRFRCRVYNAAGSVFSDEIWLVVNLKPRITTQPEDVTVDAGEVAVFTVEATDAISYQWEYQKDNDGTWTKVSKNGTSATYTLTTELRHNWYRYRCAVTNAVGTRYSQTARLYVKDGKPVITTQPKSVTVKEYEDAIFQIVATGSLNDYQWQYKKPGTDDWVDVSSNGQKSTYTLCAQKRHNGYKYRCVVKNHKGTDQSIEVTLTVKSK